MRLFLALASLALLLDVAALWGNSREPLLDSDLAPIELAHSATSAAPEPEVQSELARPSGDCAQSMSWALPRQSYWYHTPGPGSYLLSIPPIPGFESIPDRTLHISHGEMLKVEIKLVRKGS